MRKLIQGLLEFRRQVLPASRATFTRLARGQSPDCLFLSCADSRVVPHLLASTHPGDLFVVRNVGNMVPPGDGDGVSTGDPSEAAALEFCLLHLAVRDIIVCGHSECGAMTALLERGRVSGAPNLAGWLRHGAPALAALAEGTDLLRDGGPGAQLPVHDRLSQLNVLAQLAHLRSYPLVRAREAERRLRLHGWWFDIGQALVHTWEPEERRFEPIDEEVGERLLARLGEAPPAEDEALQGSSPGPAAGPRGRAAHSR
jgi:carbonic anhydrase